MFGDMNKQTVKNDKKFNGFLYFGWLTFCKKLLYSFFNNDSKKNFLEECSQQYKISKK